MILIANKYSVNYFEHCTNYFEHCTKHFIFIHFTSQQPHEVILIILQRRITEKDEKLPNSISGSQER